MATAIISRLREIRESHSQQRTLWRELGECDMADLQAAIARSDTADGETERLLRILTAQRSLSA
jgi:hypothetical protein